MRLDDNTKYTVVSENPSFEEIMQFCDVFVDERLELLKYYDSDEEILDYPHDVLDVIDDRIDFYERRLDMAKANAQYRSVADVPTRSRRRCEATTPADMKRVIKHLEELRQRVLDEDYSFYVRTGLYDLDMDVLPIKTVYLTAYKPVFNKEILKFEAVETKDTIKAILVGDRLYTDSKYSRVHSDTWQCSLDHIEESFGTDAETVIKLANVPSGEPSWKLCKDCGRPFRIASTQIDWFINSGMSIPRRCMNCRSRNKKQKAWDTSAELGRQTYIEVHGSAEGFDPVAYIGEERPV